MSYEIIQLEQGSLPWLAFRRNHITATDTAVILNIAYKKTPYQLWQEKLGLREPEPENEAMREGKILEEQCREFINREMKTDFKPVVLQSSIHEFMMASTDGMNTNGEVLEIKCGRKSYENALNQILETYYYSQLQKIMYVANVDKILYVCYRNNNEYIKNIYFRDNVFIEKMIEAEIAFYKCLMDFTSPPACDKDFVKRDSRELQFHLEIWKQNKAEMKLLEAKDELLRDTIIKMCEGQSSECNGVRIAKQTRRGNVDFTKVKELQGVDLEPYRNKPTTSFRFTEVKD